MKTETQHIPPAKELNPHLKVVLATLIMGSSGVFIKYLALPPGVLACFRLAIPTVALYLYFHLRKVDLFRYPVKWMLLGSLLNAVRIYLFINSFVYTGIANAIVILYSWPVFATLFSRLILKEKVSRSQFFLLLLPLSGIAIIFSNQHFSLANDDFIGMGSMLLSAILYALSVIVFKKEAGRYSGFETVFFQNLVGSVLFVPFLFLADFDLSLGDAGVIFVFASSIGIVAFGLFFSALRRIKASTVSFLSYLEVIVASTYGVLIYDEVITWRLLLGGVLIIVSTLLLTRKS